MYLFGYLKNCIRNTVCISRILKNTVGIQGHKFRTLEISGLPNNKGILKEAQLVLDRTFPCMLTL